jgi:hypothetical protein
MKANAQSQRNIYFWYKMTMPLSQKELRIIADQFMYEYIRPQKLKLYTEMAREVYRTYLKIKKQKLDNNSIIAIIRKHLSPHTIKVFSEFLRFYWHKEQEHLPPDELKAQAIEYIQQPIMTMEYTETEEHTEWRLSLNQPKIDYNISTQANAKRASEQKDQDREALRLENLQKRAARDKQKMEEDAARKQQEIKDAQIKTIFNEEIALNVSNHVQEYYGLSD